MGFCDPADPRAPLQGDLTGLPSLRVHVGEDAVLLDDSRPSADNDHPLS